MLFEFHRYVTSLRPAQRIRRCIPRQQTLHGLYVRQIRRIGSFQQPDKVLLTWIEIVLHRGLEQAVDHSASGRALGRIGEQPVLSANREQLDAPLCTVVG